MKQFKWSRLLFLLSVIVISGCEQADTFQSVADGTDTGTGGVGTDPTQRSSVYLGSGSGADFTAGTLALGVSTLSAGGSTTVTATIADGSGTLMTTPTAVNFSSSCKGQGLAEISSPVTTVDGYATSTYKAMGCSGDDAITATATVGEQALSATATLNVLPPEIGAISFISANPSIIRLKGMGNETSSVTFKVLDKNGNPVSGQTVDFALSSTLGGISLASASGVSASEGLVSATVNSGDMPTTVQVLATIRGTAIATHSDGLVISTGMSHQVSMSLAASVLNPEAGSYDGNKVTLTVHASDHFSNPVPDGTSVYFTAEGGQIESRCATVNGACSVQWTSTNPRPTPDGRATILAVIQGEESFTDVNSNRKYDDGESFGDLPEAFRDDDENEMYDVGLEEFRDYNSDGVYNDADGKYSGQLCAGPTLCATSKTVENFRSLVLVMANSEAVIGADKSALDLTVIKSDTVTVWIADRLTAPQVMPAGTTVEFSTTNGKLVTKSSFTVSSTNAHGPLEYTVGVEADDKPGSGVLEITVTAPSGTQTYATIPVTD